MLSALLLSAASSISGAAQLEVEAQLPNFHVLGSPYVVNVVYATDAEPVELDAWRFGIAAFDVNGAPLGDRGGGAKVVIPRDSTMTFSFDLSGHIDAASAFQLGVEGVEGKTDVGVYTIAPAGIDFLTHPVEDLANFHVLLQTNQGDMLAEFYPDLAPEHVRNFLDLSGTGFYDGTQFHRVSPDFMIQGGCPNTKTDNKKKWGTGSGPRMLKGEFSKTKHVRGILSMARGQSPNSGSSQFFVMTVEYPTLDGKYSVFGNLVGGFATLDAIATAKGSRNPKDGTVRPSQPQRIEKAVVLVRG